MPNYSHPIPYTEVYIRSLGAGTGSVIKSGTGTLTLAADNSYTGATTVNAGTLIANHDHALGTASAGTTIKSGGTLAFQGGRNISGEDLTANGTGAAGQPGAIANLSGINTYTGTITAEDASSGTLGIGSAAGTLTLNGSIHERFSQLTFNGAGDVVVNSDISGLGANQTFGGITETIFNSPPGDVVNNIEAFRNHSLGASDGRGTLTGSLSYADDNAFSARATQLGAVGFDNNDYSGLWMTSFVPNEDGVWQFKYDSVDDLASIWLDTTGVSGIFDGSDRLFYGSGGSLSGSTPSLLAGHSYLLGIVMTDGGGAGNFQNMQFKSPTSAGWTGGNFATVNPTNYPSAFPMVFIANNALVKQGTGTVTLAGANTYNGATTINAGTLIAANNSALGTGGAGTTVNNGATLGLSGNVTLSNEALSVNGIGAAGRPGALANISGDNTIAASSPIVAQVVSLGQVGIGATSGTLTINSTIDLKSSKLIADGSGMTILNGAISGTGDDVGVSPTENVGATTGVFTNVAEANGANGDYGYVLAYELSPSGSVDGNQPFPYTRDNTATIRPFDRIAYYLELQAGSGPLEYVYVSMDAFTNDITKIGIPNGSNLYKWQQTVSHLNVFSNRPSTGNGAITTGTDLATGNIEIWPSDYGPGNSTNIPNANAGSFDFGDDSASTNLGYGAFQIHNYDIDGAGTGTTGQTLLAYNYWRGGGDLGIGTNTGGGQPDWTFSGSLPSYSVKRMAILVHETAPRTVFTDNSLVKQGTGTLTLGGANTFNGTASINAGTVIVANANGLGVTAAGTTVASGAVLDLNGQSIGAEGVTLNGTGISSGGALINSSGTAASLSGNVALASTSSIGGSGNFTLSGAITDGSGATDLTKVGPGTVTLSGTNNYSGATSINGGTLALQSTYGSSSFSIATSSVLELNVASGSTNYGTATFSGTGTLRKTGSGTATWPATQATFNLSSGALIDVQAGTFYGGSFGNEVWTNNLSGLNVASGASFEGVEANIRVDAITGSGTIASGFSNGGTITFGLDNASSTFDGVFANTLNHVGAGFTKAGTSTITLNGANTHTSATIVSAGTLKLGNASALGTTASGTTVSSGAVLDLNGQSIGAEAVTLNGTGISSGGALINSSGTTASLSGNITLASASSIGGSGNATYSGTVNGGFGLTLVGAGTKTFSGIIGDSTPLASITQNDATGSVRFNENVSVGSGGATFNADVTLDGLTFTSGGAVTFGNAATDSLTISGGATIVTTTNGNVTLNATTTGNENFSLGTTLNPIAGGITFNAPVTMATDKNFSAVSTSTSTGINLPNTNSDISATGTGTILLTAARNVALASGSSVTTVNGGLTIEANQQSPITGGSFHGVLVDGGLIQATGTGTVTVKGRSGGESNSGMIGVKVENGGDIVGGTSGTMTVIGTGGGAAVVSTQSLFGVFVRDGSTISSGGANVSVTGTGGSSGFNGHFGVGVHSNGQITAGGSGAVTVVGQGGTAQQGNYGVYLSGPNTRITSSGGNVSVNGTAGGPGNGSGFEEGIHIDDTVQITAGGSGTVTVVGQGGASNHSTNSGLFLGYGTITSSGGNVTVTGTPGNATSSAIELVGGGTITTATNGGTVTVIGDSMSFDASAIVSAQSGSSVTLRQKTNGVAINLGGADAASILGLTDAELDRVTAGTINIGDANSGTITFSADITRAANTNINLTTGSGNNIAFGAFSLNAGTGGDVTLTTSGTGAITTGDNTGTGLTADDVTLNAGSGGIGSTTNFLRLAATTVTATTSGTGGINLVEADSVTIAAGGLNVGTGTITLGGGTFDSTNALSYSTPVSINSGATLNANGTSPAYTQTAGTLTVNGTLTANAISLQGTSTTQGTGTITGLMTVASGASVAPGNSTGILNTGNVAFSSGSTLSTEINAFTTAGTDYDQLNVTGTVSLGNATLSLSGSLAAIPTTPIVLINNDGSDAVTGTFSGLPEGATLQLNGYTLAISYVGGDGNDVVLLGADTEISLDGSGNLVVSDFAATTNDNITIKSNTTSNVFVITDPGCILLTTIAGATGSGTDTVTVPFSAVTGANIFVITLAGNDSLTVDLSLGNFSKGLTYNGGTQTTSDSLTLTGGGTFASVAHTLTNANDGSINITGNSAINYTGLEPITDNLSAIDRVFSFNGGDEVISLIDATGSNMTIDSTLSELITFKNPTGSVTINAGSGDDTVNAEGVDAAYSGTLTINGDAGSDNVNFRTNPTNLASGGLNVSAENVSVTQTLTAGSATLTADAINIAATLTANGGITLQPDDDTDTIGLGTGSGSFSLTETELTNLSSTGTVTIGRSTGTGAVDIADSGNGNIDLSGEAFPLTLRGGATVFNAGLTLPSDKTLTLNTGAITSPHSGTDVTIGGSGTLSVTASGAIGTSADPLTMSVANLNTSSGNSDQSLSTTASTTIGTSGLNAGTGAITLASGTFVASDASSFEDNSDVVVNGTFDLHGNSETLDALSGSGIVDTSVAGAITLTTGHNAGSGSFGGVLQNTSGTLSLTVAGGALLLTNANTYSGTTNVNAGVLDISNAAALGATSAGTTIAVGAQLNVSASMTVNEPLSLAGELRASFPAASGLNANWNSDITLTGTSATFKPLAANDLLTVSGILSGTAMTKSGSGQLTLTNANTYTGATTISAGRLSVSGSLPDATDVSVASGAIYDIAASDTIDGLTGSGSVTLGANTLTVGSNNETAAIFSGAISNTGSLTKIGTGKQSLSGANTFTGATTINVGTLSVSGSLSDSTDVSVALNATYDVAANDSIDALSGAGRVTLGANTLTIGANNEVTATFSGLIRDTGSLTKIGTGKQILSGANTYTGATTIDAGTLSVNGSLTSSVIVNPAGTLAGTGSITGSVTGAGAVSPGNSAGTITINGDYAHTSASDLNLEIGGLTAGTQFDRLIVNGTVTLAGDLNVSLISGFAPTSTNTFKIIDNDGSDPVSGTFAGLIEGAVFTVGGAEFQISYVGGSGNDVVLSLPTPDIVLNSVTTNGYTTLTVTYQILNSALTSPLGIRFLKSTDMTNNAGDTTLSNVVIKNVADLTVGSHSVTYTIGATVGSQVQLPGAILTQADTTLDYYLLATIDATNSVIEVDSDPLNEDNTKVLTGAYVTPKAIYVHGSETGDAIQLSYPAATTDNITLTTSGGLNSSYIYPYATTTQFRLRTHGGNDSVSYLNPDNLTMKPMFEFGGEGDDMLVSGQVNDTLNGGNGLDTLVASGNVHFILTNTRLTGLGTDTLTSIEAANLTGGGDSNNFTVTGWTGTGTFDGGTGPSTSILGNVDTIIVSKDVNFTLTDSALQTSDGITLSLSGISRALLTGGSSNNSFNITGWTGTGKLTGGAGSDTLAITRNADMSLVTKSATTSLTTDGLGLMSLTTIEVANLTGGASNNTFTLNNWLGTGTIFGGGGSDTVIVTATASAASFTLTDAQLVVSNGFSMTLVNIATANLIGGTSANSFDVSGWHGSGLINGGGGKGIDTVIAAANADFMLSTSSVTDSSLSLSTGLSMTLSNVKRARLTGLIDTHVFVVSGWTPSGTTTKAAGEVAELSR